MFSKRLLNLHACLFDVVVLHVEPWNPKLILAVIIKLIIRFANSCVIYTIHMLSYCVRPP